MEISLEFKLKIMQMIQMLEVNPNNRPQLEI